ncbi:MAG: Intracellular proteinase inhibitor [Chthoniobacter sp.]|jgi:hypothetical protein|nr:Intracellular proteinase inhibitor [Chthoniobacter sp.]
MNFRLACLLCLTLACQPLHAAQEKAKPTQDGWLKRVARTVWPFKKKRTEDGDAAGTVKAPEPGKSWRQLVPSVVLEPTPLKLSEVRSFKVMLHLKNAGKKLAQLEFPTSQRIEVLIKDETGKLLEQWSEDQAFENEPTQVTINPGERLEYTATVSTRDLKAGKNYTVEGFFPNFEQLRATKQLTPLP